MKVKEELGIIVLPDQLRFIGKTKYNHRTKGQFNRTFIYSYALRVPKAGLKLKPNPEESSVVFFISEKKLRRALRVHRIKNIGKISSLYSYWRYLLDSM